MKRVRSPDVRQSWHTLHPRGGNHLVRTTRTDRTPPISLFLLLFTLVTGLKRSVGLNLFGCRSLHALFIRGKQTNAYNQNRRNGTRETTDLRLYLTQCIYSLFFESNLPRKTVNLIF